jgi:hypothetical protein
MMNTKELRPLSLGELLDRIFSCYKEHFILFVGIMAIPQVFLVGVGLVSQGVQQSALHAGPNVPAQGQRLLVLLAGAGIFLLIMLLGYAFAYAAALGGTAFGISEIYLGRSVTIRAAYGKMRGRVWALLRVQFVIALMIFIPFFFAALAAVLLPVQRGPSLLFIGLILLLFAAVPWAVWMLLRYALAIPVLLLEGLSAPEALKRSVVLTKGYLGRIFLIALLATLIGSVVVSVFEGPFWVAMAILAAKGSRASLWLGYPMALAGGISRAVSSPLLTIGTVLAYYDARVRKEGFDLQLMMAALDTTHPGSGQAQPEPS